MTTTDVAASTTVPDRLRGLVDLAYNLWWSWDDEARSLFRDLDPLLWDAIDHNAARFLHQLPMDAFERARDDDDYLRRYDAIMDRFSGMRERAESETWVGTHLPALADRPLAYFSAEFGLHRSLPIYSGGLGVLAGDHIKEASDLGLPLVAVSLLYRQGYLSQRLSADGWQEDVPAVVEPWEEPTTLVRNADGEPLMIELVLDNPDVPMKLQIWRVQGGRVSLYLLDADVDGNPEWTRGISSRLYGGDMEHRLRQELILGVGGVRALRAMGVQPVYWHANEGHAAFHLLERCRELVEVGRSFEEASRQVAATTVFTTHTPVPAGHDVFPPYLMDRYFSYFWPELTLSREQFLALGEHTDSGDGFNLTALSFRLAGYRNGVSERHGQITRLMWHDIWQGVTPADAPITSITNGIHLPTWIAPHVKSMLDRHLGDAWRKRPSDPATWELVRDIGDEEFWRVHLRAKRILLDTLRERSRRRFTEGGFDPGQILSAGPFLEEGVLTIGFARRFATYKRATLLFHDPDRLARILNDPERPVQIIFAGKAHPADEGGKRLIQEICWRARDPKFGGRIAFAEDYDMGLAGHLVAGVDVWLNNPRAPLEASGTSGMKASANGVPNLSILDGWWREAWQPGNLNGWGIEPSSLEGDAQDAEEADAIYRLLEYDVVPKYYDRDSHGVPTSWIAIAKAALSSVAPAFSAHRMLEQYMRELYLPASGGNDRRAASASR
jgi:starch phosphorylase